MHYTNILLAGLCLGLCFDVAAMDRVLKKPKGAEASQEEIHHYFIPLESSDGQSFEISQELAVLSPWIIREIGQHCIGSVINLPIDGTTLEQVIGVLTRLALLPREELDRLKTYAVAEESVRNNSLLQTLYNLGIPIAVDVVSSDSHPVCVPFQVACHSETLKKLFMDTGNSQAIPLNNINGATLVLMMKLLYKLDELIAQRAQNEYLYIPRAFQAYVNEHIGKLIDDVSLRGNEVLSTSEWKHNNEQKTIVAPPPAIPLVQENMSLKTLDVALELLSAANYLDNYYLVNAVAAAIADQIPRELYDAALKVLSGVEDAEAQEAVNASCCKSITRVQKDLRGYLMKHITHRKGGITEEYSIADLIKEKGQPMLETVEDDEQGEEMPQCLDLRKKKLTSLSGLKLLEKGPQAECLLLQDNCFYDVSLDKEVEEPFANCGNLLRLDLSSNQLSTLPEGLFNGLNRLIQLRLYNNKLSALPAGLFEGLNVLMALFLDNNKLSALREGLFVGLNSLIWLRLENNELSALSEGLFVGLNSLIWLQLDNNELSTLSVGLFGSLNSLRELSLINNQLSDDVKISLKKEFKDKVSISL